MSRAGRPPKCQGKMDKGKEDEPCHGTSEDNDGTGPALAQRRQSRRRRGRHVRLCGQIDGRLLSPVLPVAHGQAEERHVLRDLRGCGSAPGYRACRRCNPKGPSLSEAVAAVVAEACRRIEDAEEPPKLDALAASVGHEPVLFPSPVQGDHRPDAEGVCARPHRAKRVRAELADRKTSVTEAIYGAGFNSNSRFYESSNEVLGMTPTALSRRAARTPTSASPSANARSAPSWSRAATRASAPSCWATIPTRWCATCRTASRRPT